MKPKQLCVRPLMLATLLLAAAPAVWSAGSSPKVHTLENGLTVVLLEDHSAPLVAEAVWVHAGGKDESEQLAGFSHYLEHLIPMGTRDRTPLQQSMEIFRAGGLSSIQADYDRTFFFAEVGAAEQNVGLDALFQQVTQASLSEKGVDRVRPVLTRELKEAYDNPKQVLFLEQMRAAFPGQPYRFPYLGNFNTLATLEHFSADSFYGNFYVPNNMVVAVGGDINPSKILAAIRKLFGALKPSKTLPARPRFEPAFTGPRTVVKNLPRMETSVSILFPTPGYRHPDRFALAVLARLLDDGAVSPLHNGLADPQKSLLSLSSRFHLFEERGLLAFTAHPALPGMAQDTALQMLAVLRRVRAEGFPEADVSRTVRQMRLEAAIQRDPVGAMVQDLAEGALFGDVRYGWDLEANLGKVSAADVKRVAAAYLAGSNAKTLTILPKSEKTLTQEEQDRLKQAATELDSGVTSAPVPDFSSRLYPLAKEVPLFTRSETRGASPATRMALPNGLILVLKPDRGRGIVAASLQIRAGSAFDPGGKEGLSQMVASAVTLGTSTIPAKEFRLRAAAIGSTFGITSARESVEAGLTVFPEDLPEALTLLSRPIVEPLLPEEQVTAVRERILRFGEAWSASPEEAARLLVREKIYRDHPYGRSPTGTEASLNTIRREDLVAFHRRFYRPDRAVLCIAGDFTLDEARRLVTTAFGAWRAPTDEKAPPELPEGAAREAISGEFSRVVERQPAAVVLGFPGVSLRDPDFPLVRALGGLLGARGTLDLVLNEPMAYSITALPEGLSRGGLLYVEASAPASEISRVAYELILRARALGVKEVTPATVMDLIAIEKGRLLREKEGLYALASNLGFYELIGGGFAAYDEGRTLPEPLTPAVLKEGAARFLDASRLVRVTAGPSAR